MANSKIIFEVDKSDTQLSHDIEQSVGGYAEIVSIDSFSGGDVIQVVITISAIVAPVVSELVKKYYESNKVTIKYDNIEITALGVKKVLALLNEIKEKDSKHDN